MLLLGASQGRYSFTLSPWGQKRTDLERSDLFESALLSCVCPLSWVARLSWVVSLLPSKFSRNIRSFTSCSVLFASFRLVIRRRPPVAGRLVWAAGGGQRAAGGEGSTHVDKSSDLRLHSDSGELLFTFGFRIDFGLFTSTMASIGSASFSGCGALLSDGTETSKCHFLSAIVLSSFDLCSFCESVQSKLFIIFPSGEFSPSSLSELSIWSDDSNLDTTGWPFDLFSCEYRSTGALRVIGRLDSRWILITPGLLGRIVLRSNKVAEFDNFLSGSRLSNDVRDDSFSVLRLVTSRLRELARALLLRLAGRLLCWRAFTLSTGKKPPVWGPISTCHLCATVGHFDPVTPKNKIKCH